ncbi:hypothetical protein ACF044_10830 [Microbacterium sp. NPDC016588]
MAVSLNDVTGWIKDIFYRLRKLESGAFLENSSITNGRLRIIGGTLLVDSGGQLIVVGTASVDGSMSISGTFLLTGSGWRIVGSGSIEGPTTVIGTLRVDGDTRFTGNLSLEGDIALTGNMGIAAGGRFTAGDVTIEEDEVTVGGGSSPATLRDGALSFATGGKVEADTSVGGARLSAGTAVVNVGAVASIRKGPSSVIVAPDTVTLNAAGGGDIDMIGSVHIPGIPTASGTGLPLNTLLVTTSGYLRRSDGT